MTTKHPYPPHVLKKVAAEIRYSVPTLEPWEARALAESVLTTLWNTDQPSTISVDEARTIWNHAISIRRGSIEAMHELRLLLAQHAPDWNGTKR